MKVLHLTLKKKWFDMIASGEKKEEYRELKRYWMDRFVKIRYPTSYEDYYPDELLCELKKHGDFNLNAKFFDAHPVHFDVVCFRNGYAKNAPSITIECDGIEVGKPISGLSEEGWIDTNVFIIKLGKILTK